MASLIRDLRHALRMLVKTPGVSIIVILTTGVGIAASTLVFSLVNAVLLRPLPYQAPDRLVVLRQVNPEKGITDAGLFDANIFDLRNQARAFEGIAYYGTMDFPQERAGEERLMHGALCSRNLFPLLGVSPILGHFLPGDVVQSSNAGVVISHGLWQREFGADPNVVGRPAFGPGSAPVRGVMPRGFAFPYPLEIHLAEFWWQLWEPNPSERRGLGRRVVARLKPGVTLEQARAEADVVMKRIEQSFPAAGTGWRVSVVPLQEEVVGGSRRALLMLFGAVLLVLLIACGNIANLLLARAIAKRKESAIRVALGASRSGLVRRAFAEHAVLALIGGALGLLVALWALPLIVALAPSSLTIPRLREASVDTRVLLFALAASLTTGALSAVIPALHSSRVNPSETLKGAHAFTVRRALLAPADALVLCNVALAFVLLTGAGLMLKSFWKLQTANLGYEPKGLTTAVIQTLPSGPAGRALLDQFLERTSRLPAVRSVAAVDRFPIPGYVSEFKEEGRVPSPGERFVTEPHIVTRGYFDTMGMSLIKGRLFAPGDTQAIVISQEMARLYWPGADPIGRSIVVEYHGKTPWAIIGVVADVRRLGLADAPKPDMYIWDAERPQRSMSLLVRASETRGLIPAMRAIASQIDKRLAIGKVAAVERLLWESRATFRFIMLLLVTFASIGTMLAALGLYALISYTAARRAPEMAVRLAVGAQRGDVIALVVRRGVLLALAGIALGCVAALVSTRVLSSFLYGTQPTDFATFLCTAILFLGIASAASYVPARRTARVDPLALLKTE